MDKEQLIEEISSKIDDRDYRLILDLNGEFKLISLSYWNDEMKYVTRWETYNEGDGYVGTKASEDEDFIDDIYSWAEEAWDIYEKDGETNILNPYS